MNAAYYSVMDRLAAKGIRSEFHRPHQLVLPSRVWLTCNERWYISTWTPAIYPVPANVDVTAVCQDCLNWPDDPFYEIPAAICERYGLSRMDDAEFDQVRLIPPDDDAED
jgi:hypothetical protein